MKEQGTEFWDWCQANFYLFFLATSMMIIKDAGIILSNFLRGITVRSKTYKGCNICSILALVCLVLLTIKMRDTYNIPEARYSGEPRQINYQRMLEYYDIPDWMEYLDPMTILRFIIFVRICFLMTYTVFWGKLMIIIFEMVLNSFNFLLFYFLFLVLVSTHCNYKYWELESYETYSNSLFNLFGSALGGFDFTEFSGSYKLFSENGGRVFLLLYLTMTTIILLNFFIAILSDVYSRLYNYNNGMRMQKIIEMRQIYEYHPHYLCLTKMPIMFSPLLLVVAPIVIITKSEKFNRIMLRIEGLLALMILLIGFIIFAVVLIIPILIYALIVKIKSLGKKDRGLVIRLIDLVFYIFLLPMIYICALFLQIYVDIVFSSNIDGLARVIEVDRDEYNYINKKMDGTFKKKNEPAQGVEFQKEYYLFKKLIFGNNRIKNKYDPDNAMISEMALMTMTSVLTIITKRVKKTYPNEYPDDSVPIYLPSSYLMKELSRYMFTHHCIQAIVFGENAVLKNYEQSLEFNELVEELANRSLDNSKEAKDPSIETFDGLDEKNLIVQAS